MQNLQNKILPSLPRYAKAFSVGGLYLLAFLLPLQTHYLIHAGQLKNQVWEFGNIALYGVDILLITIILLWLPTQFKKTSEPKKLFSKLNIAVLILLIISALSIIPAFNHQLALYGSVRLLMGILLFTIITTVKFNRKLFATIIIVSAMVQAVWGLGQFLTQETYANKWLGTAIHQSGELGTSVLEIQGPDGRWERWLRSYAGLPHPNILGAFLALSLILAFGLIVKQITRTDINETDKKKFNQYDTVWYFGLIIISAGLFFTFSRSAIIAGALGILIILILNFKAWKKMIVPVALILVTIIFCAWHYSYLYQARVESTSRLEVKSLTERTTAIGDALSLIKTKPLGWGIDNYGLAVYEQLDKKQSVFSYQPVHNVFLLVGVELGIVGLLAFIALLSLILAKIWHHLRMNLQPSLEIGLLVGLFVLMTLDHYLWSLVFGIYLFWLILGLVYSRNDLV